MRSVLLAATVLVATPATAYAHPPPVIGVRCAPGALRAAVAAANRLGTATIRLSPECVYGFTAPAGRNAALPRITGNLTLTGSPTTAIRRDPAARAAFGIIDVAPGGTLRARDLSIQNGDSASGGGIDNEGTVYLDHVTLTGNNASDGGGFSNATARSRALITHSLISANMAGGGGGAANSGRLTLVASRVTANSAPEGGGGGIITAPGATTTVVGTTVDHNVAGFGGGGLLNLGVLTLDHAVVTRNLNSAVNGFTGGGVFDVTPPGTVRSTGSVIRDNSPADCSPPDSFPGCANRPYGPTLGT